jgi:hypothetical protein
MQKRAPGGLSAPQLGQRSPSSAPQDVQNRARSGFSAAQEGQLLPAAVMGPTIEGLRYAGAPQHPSQETILHRIRALIVLSIAVIAAVAISACGGGGGDEDPQEVLDATFSNDEKINSGVFDVSVDVSAEGGENAGSFDASLGGPFQGADGGFPSFDIDAEINLDSDAQDFSGSAGLTSTGDSAFLNFQDTDYEVPQQAFDQFAATFTQLQDQTEQQGGDGNFLSSLGVNPTNWLTDLSNEGDEDVEGTETIHISGEADVPKLVEDFKKIAENAPQAAQQVTPAQLGQLDQLTGIIESADFDIFTGADDDLLRKLEANLELNPPDAEGSPDSVSVNFSVTLSGLNEPQEIAAPASAQPLGDLLQQFGVDESALGQLGGAIQGGSGGGGGGAGGGGLPQAGGNPDAPSGNASQAYLDCLAAAEGAAAVQQCAALLEQ